jgi:ubiquitin-like domain-containing CTD phosphatase 1
MKRCIEDQALNFEEDEVALRVSWCGSAYAVELSRTSTVADLKSALFSLTEVLPKRQKVLGIPRTTEGLPVTDETAIAEIPFKQEHKLMLVGTREEDISQVHTSLLSSLDEEVFNDLDFDYASGSGSHGLVVRNPESNARKLKRRLETTEIRIINELRPGKKLLVLDLDYTLFDCKGNAEMIADLGRPGLHRFLSCCYRYYDIVIWSQTSWRWLEAKLTELSMLLHADYKISFVLDRTSMFSITSRKGADDRKHEVKALEIIWKKFPGRWDASNSIHIDDLSRNFALNPQSGLKILPFKNARITRSVDRELYHLMRYLSLIAKHERDFRLMNHKTWKRYCEARVSEVLEDESDLEIPEASLSNPAFGNL